MWPILILVNTTSSVRLFWLLVCHFSTVAFIALSLFEELILDQRFCHFFDNVLLMKGCKSSGEHSFIGTVELGFLAAISTISLPRMLQCEGHHRNVTVLPASFKSFQHETILAMIGLEQLGLDMALSALRESLMMRNIRAGKLHFWILIRQRRIDPSFLSCGLF